MGNSCGGSDQIAEAGSGRTAPKSLRNDQDKGHGKKLSMVAEEQTETMTKACVTSQAARNAPAVAPLHS